MSIRSLCTALSEAAYSVINPGSLLVVDESLYEFNGDCPVRRYIPRKPHQNGLLVYGLAGYFHFGTVSMPYCIDFEPYVPGNLVSPQNAMMALLRRIRQRKPTLAPHLIVDSAFGSLEKLREIRELGAHATMSMSSNSLSGVWELLDFNCGVDEGRLAYLPGEDIIISSFKVMTDRRELYVIKTISSGCKLAEDPSEEEIVSSILCRREVNSTYEYQVEFKDGHREWLAPQAFIDDDGTVNLTWLHFAEADDLSRAFGSYTHAVLKVLSLTKSLNHFSPFPSQGMCAHYGWKATGDKRKVLGRIVKKLSALKEGREGVLSLIESKVGVPSVSGGSSSQLRRFYTDNYPALDRFDREWYNIESTIRPSDWESHFCWSLLQAAVINARTVWCATREERVPTTDFLNDLVSGYVNSLENK